MTIRKRRGAKNPARKPQGHSRRKTTARASAGAERQTSNRSLRLYGVHPVAAALANPARRCHRLTATASALEDLRERLDGALEREGLVIAEATRDEVARLLDDGVTHQGLALDVAPLPRPSFDEICVSDGAPRLLLLDRINDPRNLGAVIRAAAAFEAGAVIVPDRHAPEISGDMAKAASGMLELVPLVRVANIARAIEMLQRRGYWCIGLDGGATQTLASAKPDGAIALVLGAEGAGLRRLTRERCDVILRLPISDAVESLNLATAAAVALYALSQMTPGDEAK